MKINFIKIISIIGVIVLVCIFLCYYIYRQSNESLEVSQYTLTSDKIVEKFKIVQLTDLHNSEFGFSNEDLIQMIGEQSPSLILITGDILNSDDKDTSIAEVLIYSLSDIAPVYISLGNQEIEYQEKYGVDMISLYEAAGATVLDKSYIDLEVKGQKIRLGGIYGYCLPERYLETGEAKSSECDFLREFQDTELYTILMCHMPVCWLINDGLDEWDVDCVLSGHVHGGQIILPLVGGLYAPDMGFFPGSLEGIFQSKDERSVMVLSRGLGSKEKIPRWNNIPEIVVIDLIPTDK